MEKFSGGTCKGNAHRARASFRVSGKVFLHEPDIKAWEETFSWGLFPASGEPSGEEGKNMNKEQAMALADEAKKKAIAIWTICKEKIVTTWKSGRKGKGICIVGAVVVLLILTRCGGGSVETGRGGKFSGKNFSSVFMGMNTQDEGMIYEFSSDISIKVLQATKKGNLVGYVQGSNPFAAGVESFFGALGGSFDRMVWVETARKRYEDGETLGGGFYIRRGSHEYEGIDGGEHTVARYVEVTDKASVKKLQKQADRERAAAEKAEREEEMAERKAKQEERAKAEAKAKAEAEAKAKADLEAEGKPFEVNATVKSLCGFAIGATPSSVISLFKKDNWKWSNDRLVMSGELASPFRHFDHVRLEFKPDFRFGGKHLARVELSIKDQYANRKNWETEEINEENKTIAMMLEKKFGIKFKADEDFGEIEYKWETTCGNGCIAQTIRVGNQGNLWLDFQSAFISANEESALKERQRPKPNMLSSDAGADQL